MASFIRWEDNMRKFLALTAVFFLLGCEQLPEDPDNAVVSGYIYKKAVATDSVFVDNAWTVIKWDFYDPAESVHVWVESDLASSAPYVGPDISGYTDENGLFSIPVYLGHKEQRTCAGDLLGYEYVYYADVRVFALNDIAGRGTMSDFGSGITLNRGSEFRLWTIALQWFI
jgi:hypothetical protein